jgi:phage-related baseplate assembly protein
VDVDIRLNTGSPQGAVLAAVESNLRAFYAPSRAQFGRWIARSEIIAVIEGTEGVDRIVPFEVSPANDVTRILREPLIDTKLREFELPKLVDVTVHVV